uniref:Uncharacterized protein n=1 Tax=Glossina brevipalpis TaxID=37001 RepID=A0A1A9WSX2_9MUSC
MTRLCANALLDGAMSLSLKVNYINIPLRDLRHISLHSVLEFVLILIHVLHYRSKSVQDYKIINFNLFFIILFAYIKKDQWPLSTSFKMFTYTNVYGALPPLNAKQLNTVFNLQMKRH